MMKRRACAAALIFACLVAVTLRPALTPAQAKPMNIIVTASGLVVHGIPLPAGAKPSLAANLSLEELQAMASGVSDLGRGRLQAVVYQLQIAAPPDAVADFYQRELRRPVVRVVPNRVDSDKTPDDGIRVLSFAGTSGYLAIRAEDATQPSRVTVAMVEGSLLPAALLFKAVDSLAAGGGSKPGQGQASPLLSPPWETFVHLEGVQVDLLKRSMEQGDAPGPVVDVRRALLRQARSLNLMSHQAPRGISPLVILTAFRDEAHLQRWQLMSVEEDGPQEAVALYRFPNDNGMVMLRAGPPLHPQPRGTPPGTEITRLEVMGPINFTELFRPITLRPRVASPLFAVPLPHRPFSAQRRR